MAVACAEQLSQSPDKFDVTVIEAQGYTGGQAFSIDIDEKKYGSKWMNQGVQGGSFVRSCCLVSADFRSTTTPSACFGSRVMRRSRALLLCDRADIQCRSSSLVWEG
jgi:hypothetical protein